MLGENKDKKNLPIVNARYLENNEISTSNFIRNSKRAKSIIMANQYRKQAFVHQSHLKEIFKKKYLELLE